MVAQRGRGLGCIAADGPKKLDKCSFSVLTSQELPTSPAAELIFFSQYTAALCGRRKEEDIFQKCFASATAQGAALG